VYTIEFGTARVLFYESFFCILLTSSEDFPAESSVVAVELRECIHVNSKERLGVHFPSRVHWVNLIVAAFHGFLAPFEHLIEPNSLKVADLSPFLFIHSFRYDGQ